MRLRFLLALAFLFLAAVFTYPLCFHLSDYLPTADRSGDEFQTIWFFWWMKKALLLFKNPYWTDQIYFPIGTGLAYHLSPFTNLCAIAVSTLTGAPINSALVFNLLMLGSFVVTGLAAFALIRALTGHQWAAVLGAMAVALSPYRIWHLNHLNLLSAGWGILAVHFALRALAEHRTKLAVLSALCFVAVFYASLADASFVILFLVAYVCLNVRAVRDHLGRPGAARAALVGLGLALLLVLPGLLELHWTNAEWHQSWPDLERYSADVTCLVMPTKGTCVLADALGARRETGPGGSPEVFLGWLLPALAIAVAIGLRRRVPWRWLGMAAVFLVLALGPTLLAGNARFLTGWLPYRWLFESVPYLNLSRTPGRYVSLAHLCLAIYVSHGLATWFRSSGAWESARRRSALFGTGLAAVFAAALWLEATPGKIALWPVIVQDGYRTMAADPSIRAVLEMPAMNTTSRGSYVILNPSHMHNRYMYWQTIHGHKIVNGYLTHPSRTATTLLDRVRNWEDIDKDKREELKRIGVDAVVVHDPERKSLGATFYMLR